MSEPDKGSITMVKGMPSAHPKVMSQEQLAISLERNDLVPACSSQDIHRAVSPEGKPHRKSLADLKEGIRRSVRKRFARHRSY
jgi:hypothetical protein